MAADMEQMETPGPQIDPLHCLGPDFERLLGGLWTARQALIDERAAHAATKARTDDQLRLSAERIQNLEAQVEAARVQHGSDLGQIHELTSRVVELQAASREA